MNFIRQAYKYRIPESVLSIFGIGRKPRTYRRQVLQNPEMSIITSRCLVLGVQNRILEVWRTPLILNFGVRRRFQDVIYAVRRLNGSPVRYDWKI